MASRRSWHGVPLARGHTACKRQPLKPANLALAALASFVLTFAVLNSRAAVQAQTVTNSPPAFTSDTIDRSVPENSPAGTGVGEPVAAADADNDTLTYSISGPDAGLFGIGSASGQITVGAWAALDYETRSTYAVTVTATDPSGASDATAVIIAVTDVDLGPLGSHYDADKNEVIDRDEVIASIVDYFNDVITRDETIEVIKLLFFFNASANSGTCAGCRGCGRRLLVRWHREYRAYRVPA